MDIKRIFLILPLEILYEIVTYVYVPVEINDIGYKGYKNRDKSVKKFIKSCELILNRYKSYDVGFLIDEMREECETDEAKLFICGELDYLYTNKTYIMYNVYVDADERIIIYATCFFTNGWFYEDRSNSFGYSVLDKRIMYSDQSKSGITGSFAKYYDLNTDEAIKICDSIYEKKKCRIYKHVSIDTQSYLIPTYLTDAIKIGHIHDEYYYDFSNSNAENIIVDDNEYGDDNNIHHVCDLFLLHL